jgi:hypothetical protein
MILFDGYELVYGNLQTKIHSSRCNCSHTGLSKTIFYAVTALVSGIKVKISRYRPEQALGDPES